jgi:uncharacterized RDD family membrane protein YckC
MGQPARRLAQPPAPPIDEPAARSERFNVGLLVVLLMSVGLWAALIAFAVLWLM